MNDKKSSGSNDPGFFQLVKSEWSRIGPGLRHLCSVLLLVGFALLVAGSIADLGGFWSEYPFLTNVASGITTACFGIPAAVLVVGTLTTRHQKRMALLQNSEIIGDNIAEFRASLLPILGIDREQYARELEKIVHGGIRAAVVVEQLKREEWVYGATADDIKNSTRVTARSHLEQALKSLSEANAYLDENLPGSLDLRDAWGSATTQWRLIQSEIRMRARDSGIPWISIECTAVLDGLLGRTECFLIPVRDIIERVVQSTIYGIESVLSEPNRPSVDDVFKESFVHADIASLDFSDLFQSTEADLIEMASALEAIDEYHETIAGRSSR